MTRDGDACLRPLVRLCAGYFATCHRVAFADYTDSIRAPLWRIGEDPFLTSTYAIHFIKGVQGVDPTGRGYLRAASTPKHYAGYNFDSWHGMDRYHYNALISKQDWADTYSQPFQASVVG